MITSFVREQREEWLPPIGRWNQSTTLLRRHVELTLRFKSCAMKSISTTSCSTTKLGTEKLAEAPN